MNILQALCLGVLQGLTEFLPVSSSGHLVLAQNLFGLRDPQLFCDVAVHAGTLMAVLLVFRADLLRIFKDCFAFLTHSSQTPGHISSNANQTSIQMALVIIVGSIPAALVGLLLRGFIERLFMSPLAVGAGLWTTGLLLAWSRWSPEHRRDLSAPTMVDAIWIGLVQALAITPGVSRSGATICTGLLRGLEPELAFRFSFLLSIPAILGALALEVFKAGGDHPGWYVVSVGFLAAFLVGWLALRLLLVLVGRGKLYYFAPYCFVVGTIAFVVAF
jgi:undecaprenyl-diphosphatase